VQRMNKIIKTSESLIVDSKRKAEVCVLFYPPYYASELERPVDGACELLFTASAIRRPAYFDGLLKVLQILNIDYDMMDLSKTSAQSMKSYKQVWAFSTDEMNAADQQTIVDYTKSGGNLVIFPYLPDREMSQKPCTIIRDALNIYPSGKEIIDSPLIDIYDMQDIKCANPLIVYSEESLKGADIIARTLRGSACGFTKELGSGSLTHLGTWIGFDTEGQKPVYEALLNTSDAKLRQASTSNENIAVRERFTSDNAAVLFVANYYNEEQTGKVTYTHPENGETITIPYAHGEMLWPALYGILSPVCMKVSDGLKLLHSTSDVLSVKQTADQLEISLYGDRDLEGEIVFEGPGVNQFISATLDGDDVRILRDEKRIAFIYSHKHKSEMILKVTFAE
jgi:beta-galactosidase